METGNSEHHKYDSSIIALSMLYVKNHIITNTALFCLSISGGGEGEGGGFSIWFASSLCRSMSVTMSVTMSRASVISPGVSVCLSSHPVCLCVCHLTRCVCHLIRCVCMSVISPGVSVCLYGAIQLSTRDV